MASERAEEFEATRARRRSATQIPTAVLQSRQIEVPAVPAQINVVSVQSYFPLASTAKQFKLPEAGLSVEIAHWLNDHVEAGLQKSVTDQAALLVRSGLGTLKAVRPCCALNTLIIEARPSEADYELSDAFEHVNYFSEWLLNWVRTLQADPAKGYTAVTYAYGNALKFYQIEALNQ